MPSSHERLGFKEKQKLYKEMDSFSEIKLVSKNKLKGTIILENKPHCLRSLWPETENID